MNKIEQQKLLNLFKMIWLMSPPRGKTIKQLVELLDMSQATVYRYLAFLEETDFFQVQKKGKHRWHNENARGVVVAIFTLQA